MLVVLEGRRWAGGSLKNTRASLIVEAFSSCYSLLYSWVGLMSDGAINANLSSAVHRGTRVTYNRTVKDNNKWKKNCARIHGPYVLSLCLHICVLLADESRCDARSDCNVFPPQLSKRFIFIATALSEGQREGDCQNVLCNRCNLRGGVARGRREAGAGVGRLVQIDTLHTRTACQTDKAPSSTPNQMLPCDSCEEPEQRSTEAARC